MPRTLRPTFPEIEAARAIVGRIAHETPILPSRTFSEMAGAPVFLKAENLQRTGSFKVRGAANRIAHLTRPQRARGVIAASAGNHSQGVALASRAAGIPCTIVMPRSAAIPKVEATRGYGAQVILHGATFDEAHAEAHRRASAQGLTFIPPFDDADVIAGQGTLGLELCAALPDLEAVVVPVGGGGLIAGVAVAVKRLQPKAKVYGVQVKAAPAAALAYDRRRRVISHPRPTIADGIAVGRVGALPFALIQRHVDGIVTVGEEEVAHAVMLLLERSKLLVEGAGAVGLAALLGGHLPCRGRRTVVVLSGGNVDPALVERILDHGLAHAGRRMVLRVVMRDTPGKLSHLLDALAAAEVNIREVLHHRSGAALPVGLVEVEVTAETRNAAHAAQVAGLLERRGYAPASPAPPSTPAVQSFLDRDAKPRES